MKINRTKVNTGYCDVALQLLNKEVVCGPHCPIFKKCPRLILEDASDKATTKAIEAMMEGYLNGKDNKR